MGVASFLLGISASRWTAIVTGTMAVVALIALALSWQMVKASRRAAEASEEAAKASARSADAAEAAALHFIPVVVATPREREAGRVAVDLVNHGGSSAFDISTTCTHTEHTQDGEVELMDGADHLNALSAQGTRTVSVSEHYEMECACIYYDVHGVKYRSLTSWFFDDTPTQPRSDSESGAISPIERAIIDHGFSRSVTLQREEGGAWVDIAAHPEARRRS